MLSKKTVLIFLLDTFLKFNVTVEMIGSVIIVSFSEMSHALIPVANCVQLHPVRRTEVSLYYSRECRRGDWLNSVGRLKKQ